MKSVRFELASGNNRRLGRIEGEGRLDCYFDRAEDRFPQFLTDIELDLSIPNSDP